MYLAGDCNYPLVLFFNISVEYAPGANYGAAQSFFMNISIYNSTERTGDHTPLSRLMDVSVNDAMSLNSAGAFLLDVSIDGADNPQCAVLNLDIAVDLAKDEARTHQIQIPFKVSRWADSGRLGTNRASY